MHCNNWIFDMDGTLTDSMTVVWEGAPDALLARYGRTPKSDLHKTLLTMGMADGAAYLIREYDLPLKMEDYNDVMWDVITKLYETVELKVADMLLFAITGTNPHANASMQEMASISTSDACTYRSHMLIRCIKSSWE